MLPETVDKRCSLSLTKPKEGFSKQRYRVPGAGGAYDGPAIWVEWWAQAGGAASLAALATVVRTYIRRRAGNSVTIWLGGKKIAEVRGDMSADDIVKILNAGENVPQVPAANAADDVA
ncbi:hypothetical protein J7E87_34505 [Streptomyces sp. ISL-1]|uniref:hypothetical protein n=1 Tax=Streptomyces sp. ISL-1 TaxID=2817657 RepID=UPI001BE757E5|nr:hypothetical protein [Streptomyces sp. ISL-1]MBT2394376.1 hypothetical protein [Streptomyces sp. ISL-1]